MARIDIPIPGRDEDYNSRKSKATLLNLMVEQNRDGSFKAIKKREGVTTLATLSEPATSNIVRRGAQAAGLNQSYDAWITGTTNLFTINFDITGFSGITNIGAHGINGFSGVQLIQSTNRPAGATEDQLIGIENSLQASGGDGFIFDGAINPIVDPDFSGGARSGDFLNSRFWFVLRNNKVFFCSEAGNGLNYDPLAFASADETDGQLYAARSTGSNLWLFKNSRIEYWQTFSDPTFPLRRVQGASLDVGITSFANITPIDKLKDAIAFFANDSTVKVITGSQVTQVSDEDLALRIVGDGTAERDGDDRLTPFLSMVDRPNHRYVILTMFDSYEISPPITEGFTWVYDIKTGQSHYRSSPNLDYWRPYYGHSFTGPDNKYYTVMMGNEYSRSSGQFNDANIYKLDPDAYTDDGTSFPCVLQSASLSFDTDRVIEYIEVEMETGVGNAASPNPVMTVEYSKDGGATFNTWGDVELGESGDAQNRIRMNSFGRLVRHRDFILRLTIEEPVRVEIYGLYGWFS